MHNITDNMRVLFLVLDHLHQGVVVVKGEDCLIRRYNIDQLPCLLLVLFLTFFTDLDCLIIVRENGVKNAGIHAYRRSLLFLNLTELVDS